MKNKLIALFSTALLTLVVTTHTHADVGASEFIKWLEVFDIQPGGGGGGGSVTEVLGTAGQLDVANPTTTPTLSFSDNAILPGNITAESFNAAGLGDVLGQGTLTVTNGSPVFNGSGTAFMADIGINSTIKVLGVSYTVSQVFSDGTVLVTPNYTGSDDTGVAYFIDGPMFTMTSSNGVHIGRFSNSGSLVYDAIPATTYAPSISPGGFGGTTSYFAYNADTHIFNFDSNGQVLFNVAGSPVFSVQGVGDGFFNRNLTANGNLTVGEYISNGTTFTMPTGSYDIYIPTLTSSNNGTFSNWEFKSDTFNFTGVDFFNVNVPINFPGNPLLFQTDGNPGEFGGFLLASGDIVSRKDNAGTSVVMTVDGNDNPRLQFGVDAGSNLTYGGTDIDIGTGVQVNGASELNGAVQLNNPIAYDYKALVTGIATDSSTDSGGVAQILLHNSAGNRQYGLTASENLLVAPNNTAPVARWVLGQSTVDFSVVSTDGTTNLPLRFQSDYGVAQFFGYLSVGNDLPNYKLDVQDTNAAIHIGANSGIPATPADGVVLYSNFDSGLNHSLGFILDDAGNVTQIGAGSGGGGTVTEVDVTSDLTVNGVPSGSFTVDGTIGLADTGVLASTYSFANGNFTVDAKGRLTNAVSATNIVTDVTASGALSSSGGNTPNLTLNDTAITPGTYQFPQMTLDSAGRATAASNLGSYDSGTNNLIINGTGLSAFTGVLQSTLIGDGADATGNDTVSAVALGAGAKAGIESVSIGLNAGAGSSGHTGAFFLGPNTDSTVNDLFNIAAIGYGAQVSQDKTMAYGNGDVSHIFGGKNAYSTMHIKSNSTSGIFGSNGILRLNGINDPDNTWPVTDKVIQQNAVITDGVVTTDILVIPLSNALGGSVTQAEIECSAIVGNNGPAASAVTGSLRVSGMYDGAHDTYWINGSSSATPVPIVLTLQSSDTTMALASAQVYLTGTSGPASRTLNVSVTGVNANFVNWNCFSEYFTTQATANL